MAYREVEMVEVKEVLRLWLTGHGKREIGRQVGVDPKTVRSYVAAGERAGLAPALGEAALTVERLLAVLADLRPAIGRPHGDAWSLCERERAAIEGHLSGGVRLSKTRKLLVRSGVAIPYSTLHRFAVEVLGFGRTAATVPVADGVPGEELEVDTGWVLSLPDEHGRLRRLRAWIFTANVSRHRFVWPCLKETTVSAIAACEAAWEFYGGVFRVLRPDNTKAIVVLADPLYARITPAFLEYAQARGFHVDPARARSPKDKARVERTVRLVRDDCFAGEQLRTLDDARARGRSWCECDYGLRRHTRTQRLPKEHFEAVEKPALLPAPAEPYDVPLWCEPKVARDHFAQVAKALYTLPTRFIGKTLRARADRAVVRFYDGTLLVKIHARQPPGGKSIDPNDFPPEKTPYALRDVAFLQREAAKHGPETGRFAKALLDGPLPWARMRQVYALLGLCKRYGDARVEETCALALAAEMTDVHRLERMLKRAAPPQQPSPPANVIPLARHLRPAAQYALPPASRERDTEGEDA
ncbi:MAG TPA: hypothetical protein VN835_03080 [Steroidobacteraceae bacterium]|nr:hypothetical protein [Steroidobacteraceae bacterium]